MARRMGVALPLRRSALRAAAGAALPNPRQRPGVDARGRAATPVRKQPFMKSLTAFRLGGTLPFTLSLAAGLEQCAAWPM
jgi:hypothetical protein